MVKQSVINPNLHASPVTVLHFKARRFDNCDSSVTTLIALPCNLYDWQSRGVSIQTWGLQTGLWNAELVIGNVAHQQKTMNIS